MVKSDIENVAKSIIFILLSKKFIGRHPNRLLDGKKYNPIPMSNELADGQAVTHMLSIFFSKLGALNARQWPHTSMIHSL